MSHSLLKAEFELSFAPNHHKFIGFQICRQDYI